MLGIIQCNIFSQSNSVTTKIKLYTSFIRSQLTYIYAISGQLYIHQEIFKDIHVEPFQQPL